VIWSEYFKDDHWFASHQLQHSSFLPKVVELKEKDSNKPLQEIVEDIVKFLIRWLAFHIIDDDKRLAIAAHAIDDGATLEEAKIISDRKMNGSVRVLIETVMMMYDGLSSRTLSLMRERNARIKVENELKHVNEQLKALSITDQLTGLYNRRHFEEIFIEQRKKASHSQIPLTFLLLDIDYFKKLNDHYGHSGGDDALKKLAVCLQEICSTSDTYAFRLGGEEFAIITSDKTDGSDRDFAESIRAQIEALNIPNKNSAVSEFMTVSIGVVTLVPKATESINTFMKTADKYLYKAKELGRNQIVLAD
jgi:diguanylate cyclase (GGDEF)-like protein